MSLHKSLSVIALSFAGLLLSSCNEVETVNGHVPAKYLEQAKQFEGTYDGIIGNRKGQIIVEFEEDVPHIRFENGADNDFYVAGCDSRFGQLVSVRTGARHPRSVQSVTFAFDPNVCAFTIRGRSVEFEMKDEVINGKRTISLIPYLYTADVPVRRCDFSGPNGRENCRDGVERRYLTGKFSRVLN